MRRGIVLVAVLGALTSACSGADPATGAGPEPERHEGDPPMSAGFSCVETYSPETLVHRSFAFDGTVLAIETRRDPRLPKGEQEVPWVTFHVNTWFRGGTAREVGVWIDSLNMATSAGTIHAQPGTRFLVAGEPRWGGKALEDPIAWPCGFTQPWSSQAAAEWQTAFSG